MGSRVAISTQKREDSQSRVVFQDHFPSAISIWVELFFNSNAVDFWQVSWP